jgi:hypothetical protein
MRLWSNEPSEPKLERFRGSDRLFRFPMACGRALHVVCEGGTGAPPATDAKKAATRADRRPG